MTMRLTAYGETRTALPGVPWRDLADDEWADACLLYPSIGDLGYFEQAHDEEPEPEPKAKRPAKATATDESAEEGS